MATKAEKAMLTRKAWVIQEIGWEYNDETYYRSNTDAGIPKKVYFDHARAIKDCALTNAKKYEEEMASRYPREDGDGQVLREFYELVEVEVA